MTPELRQDKTPLSNTQRAVHRLRQMIFDGELAPGSDHLETELALRLGMSRTPIREAALTLEGQGLVEVRPRRGLRVLPVSPKDMADIYDVLTELESRAAELAANRGLDAHDLRNLRRSVEAMDAALNVSDREAWAKADDIFHQELVRLSDNARIISVVAMMEDQVRRAKAVTLFMRPAPIASNMDHRQVLNAIMRGDSTTARNTHHAHRTQARKTLVSLLEQHKLRHV